MHMYRVATQQNGWKAVRHFSTWFVMLVILGSLVGCDIVSSVFDNEKEGFGSTAGPILYVGNENKPYSQYHKKQLYSIDEEGENVRKLTDYEGEEVINAKWSPDGNHIAMVRNQVEGVGNTQNLYIVDQDGKNEQKLIKKDNDEWGIRTISDPVWSSDARKIAFTGSIVSDRRGGKSYDIYTINIETGNIDKITDTPRVRETIGNWAADGNIYAGELYQDTQPMRTQLIALDESGNKIKAWGRYSEGYTYPMVSHNGNYMAFMKRGEESDGGNNTDDQTEQRVMMIPTGKDPDSAETITSGTFRSYRPVGWSPDDQQLLIMGISDNKEREPEEAPRRYHILKVSRDGMQLQDITPDNEDFYYKPVSWVDPSVIGSQR